MPFRGELVGIDALAQHAVRQAPERPRCARSGDRRGAGARARTRARRRSRERACGVLRAAASSRCAGVIALARSARWRGAAACAPGEGSSRRTSRASSLHDAPGATRAARTLDARAAALRGRRRCAPPARAARRATSRTAPSSCSTTRAARCWPGSARSATCQRAARGRRRAGAAPARLHAQALPLRAGARASACITAAIAAGRFAGADRTQRRPLPAAELRPRLQGLRCSVRTALGASRSTCRRCALVALLGADALLRATARARPRR